MSINWSLKKVAYLSESKNSKNPYVEKTQTKISYEVKWLQKSSQIFQS